MEIGNGTQYTLPNGQYINNFDGLIEDSNTAQVMQAAVTTNTSQTSTFEKHRRY